MLEVVVFLRKHGIRYYLSGRPCEDPNKFSKHDARIIYIYIYIYIYICMYVYTRKFQV